MFTSYIVSAIRNLTRQKLVSLINLFGLATAMTVVILIYLWIQHELSFDRHFTGYEQIFRVEENQFYNNERYHVNVTPWPSAPVWESEIPEIEKAARFIYAGNLLFRNGEQKFYEEDIISADSGFFRIFNIPFIYGTGRFALDQPNTMVISEKLALKYFGQRNPVGQVIEVNNLTNMKITGVFREIPSNSSFRFEAAMSFDYMVNHSRWYSDNWGNNSIFSFVKLKSGAVNEEVNRKLTEIVKQHNENSGTDFMVAPLKRMHLYSYFGYGMQQRGIQNIYIFAAVGIFILIIACINFMNLTTARAAGRAREIGIRKINGAHKTNLVSQFMGESLVMTLIAFLISVILVIALLPSFNLITGKEIPVNGLTNPEVLIAFLFLILFTGTMAGLYPSFYLASLIPVRILNSSGKISSARAWFRKTTVIIQFVLTIVLLISTAVIYGQLKFLQSKSLGYNKENLLYMPMRGDMKNSYYSLKEELGRLPAVKNITATAHPPHQIGSNSGGVDWDGKDPELELLVTTGAADFDYVETMQIEMKSGRSFSKDFSTDAIRDTLASFLINEEMETIMGTDNAIGKQFHFMGLHGPIIGVMKNYHYQSARNLIEPLAMVVAPTDYLSYIVIRLPEGDVQKHLKEIKKSWDALMPLYPFDYKFLDEDFDQLYRSEERMGSLMGYFSLVAVIIACVGLFGLSLFTAQQKTREIGIRKVFGSSVSAILRLFSKEIITLLLPAILLAWPLSYYILNSWLQNFDYRIGLNPWIFAAAGMVSLIIALGSVSFQSVKAALKNPAEALRYE